MRRNHEIHEQHEKSLGLVRNTVRGLLELWGMVR